jgi:hypothetical protein
MPAAGAAGASLDIRTCRIECVVAAHGDACGGIFIQDELSRSVRNADRVSQPDRRFADGSLGMRPVGAAALCAPDMVGDENERAGYRASGSC